jgi:hypothetical protein
VRQRPEDHTGLHGHFEDRAEAEAAGDHGELRRDRVDDVSDIRCKPARRHVAIS